jgi:hypothetical protein
MGNAPINWLMRAKQALAGHFRKDWTVMRVLNVHRQYKRRSLS